MDCSRISDQLGFYLDGALDGQALEQVETHLSGCAKCRAEMASLKMLMGVTAEIEEIDPPMSLRARIAAATTGAREAEVARTPVLVRLRDMLSPRAFVWSGGFAGAAVVAVVSFVALTHSVVPTTPTVSKLHHPTPAVVSVRPVEKAPARVAVAPIPVSSAREVSSHITRRVNHRRSIIVAFKPVAPNTKLTHKAKAHITRELRTASATDQSNDMAIPDDTTAAEIVTPSQIQPPAPKVVDNGSKQSSEVGRSSIVTCNQAGQD